MGDIVAAEGAGVEGAFIGAEEEEMGVRPLLGVKDLRNSMILDADIRDLLRLRHQLVDDAKAHEALQQRRTEAETAKVEQRGVLTAHQTGIVLVWSSLYPSGVVMTNATKLPECATETHTEDTCIIRNVGAFDTPLSK
ncbi:hypothetical protein TraAM80_00532 [Trypanosoma rangeli]|uniref:Uncharacterized protein n=1 Tax=Trypanosoma rangeli TaxID=5698 RepID=A0A422P314_TRYRA|nr:uncharacterized protein TraAM80_00532 [Trypanosoma rangeli]RNF12111.1 hypothetical protein TraAM80_00532 [Trypanosoma rangeli]|eukprot:RNF12111.1 hypothetical protein TraAM80_00532 [Trypanosoma rangeli]